MGGLNPKTSQESLSEYFSKYGELADKVVMRDGAGNPRCFGFVTYKDEASFQNCLNGRPHYVDDKQVRYGKGFLGISVERIQGCMCVSIATRREFLTAGTLVVTIRTR